MAFSDGFSESPLPLTTIFSPPSSCRTHWTYEASFYNSVDGGILLQNAESTSLDTDCFPHGFTNNGRQSQTQIFSPGHCPSGYSAPVQSVSGSVTTNICCQSSYSYFSTVTTIDNIESLPPVLFQGCLSTLPEGNTTVVPARAGNEDITTSTVSGPVTMWGQPIQVAFRASDVSFYTTATTSSTSSPSSAAISPPTSSFTSVSTGLVAANSVSPTPSASEGLSTSAKVGIGVGVAVGATTLIFLAFGFLVLRRRRKQRTDYDMQSPPGYSDKKKEAKDDGAPLPGPVGIERRISLHEIETPPTEMDAQCRAELPQARSRTTSLRAEMPGSHPPSYRDEVT